MVRTLNLKHIVLHEFLIEGMINLPANLFLTIIYKPFTGRLMLRLDSLNLKIMNLMVSRYIYRIGGKYLLLRRVLRTLNFHGYIKAAQNIVAIHKNHVRSLCTNEWISRTVYPILVRLLYGNVRNGYLAVAGGAVLI